MFVGRSGFSRDLCVVESQVFGVIGAGFTATPASSKSEVRGESHSYRNRLFVGAALAATLASSRNRGSEFIGAGFTATPASSKAEVRGESPSYRNRLFVGAALAATLCVIENRDLGVYRSNLPLRPLRHRKRGFGAEDRGSSSRRTGDGVEGNCGQLPCLNPMAQREGGGLCPSPIIQGHEPGRLSSKLPEDYH
jgi:hypothetical protein